MSDDKLSKKFQEDIGRFLRFSPMIPPPPTKCVECVEFHTIAPDLVYCKHCHHPLDVNVDTEHSQIRVIRKPTLVQRVWKKVAG